MASPPAYMRAQSSARRLAKTTCASLVLKAASVIAAFASQVILARSLGPDSFGNYVTVIASVTILSLPGGLGMPVASVLFLPGYRARAAWEQFRGFLGFAVVVTALSAAAMTIAWCAAATFAPQFGFDGSVMRAASPLLLMMCMTTLASGVLQAMQRPLLADAVPNFCRPLLITLLVGAGALAGGMSAARAAWLTVAANAAVLCGLAAIAVRALPVSARGPRDIADRRRWIATGTSLLLSLAAASLVERLDTILLGAYRGAAEAGLYSAASRLALLIGFATASVNSLLGPLSADLHARGDHAGLRQITAHGALLCTATGLVLGGGLLLCGPLLLRLFGPAFANAWHPLVILAIGQTLLAALGPAGGLLAIAGRNRPLVGVMLLAIAVDLALCIMLIPAYGITGAALATVGATLVWGGGLAAASWKLLDIDATIIGGLHLLASQGLPALRVGRARG